MPKDFASILVALPSKYCLELFGCHISRVVYACRTGVEGFEWHSDINHKQIRSGWFVSLFVCTDSS